MEGSPVSQQDLERVNADKAAAFFLLADGEAKDTRTEDAAQIVRALAVNRFCSGHVRVIVEVLEPATQNSAVWGNPNKGGIEVICPVKIHYKMMSRSCYVKGLFTFITNLFTSEIRLKKTSSKHFLSEYCRGFDNKIYPVILPKAFHGLVFEEVVEFILTAFNAVLFALDTLVKNEVTGKTKRMILLHPRGHVIEADDVGLVITWNLQTAYSISKLNEGNFERGFLQRLWPCTKHWTASKESEDHLQLLKNVNLKWTCRRSVSSFSADNLSDSMAFYNHRRAEPSSPHGHHMLKRHLRSTIHRVLCAHSSIGGFYEATYWDDNGDYIADEESWHVLTGIDDESPHFKEGLSLEAAASELLAWPPRIQYGRPHPAVLARKTDAILHNLQERTISIVDLKKPHLLVCCQEVWPTNLYYFLTGFRRQKFPEPPIVILYPQQPTAFQWGSMGIFKEVFFLQGSPLYEVDLMRGGIFQAERIIILAGQGKPVNASGEGVEDVRTNIRKSLTPYTSDVDNIVITENIKQMIGKKANILTVEMEHIIGLHYLHPQYEVSRDQVRPQDYMRNPNALVYFTSPYMEGKAVCASMHRFLLRSSFYNKNTVSIVEQLIEGGPVKANGSLSYHQLRVLEQIQVPVGYADQPYSKIFVDLLNDFGMLALGLYRAEGTLGSPTPYVFANPGKDTVVHESDLIFVLK